MNKILILFATSFLFHSCSLQNPAQEAIDASIKAHGFNRLTGYVVSFDFRGRSYTVSYPEGQKTFTRSFEDDSLGRVKDILVNSTSFERSAEGQKLTLDEEWSRRYSNSVNSVLYFFQLPFGLNEPAVNKKYLGQVFINQEPYHKIKVTFEQEGGGEDYQDIFIYWFHAEESTLDFLAYSYETDGGGVRFRKAINQRNIQGMLFQDYINYKPDSKEIELESIDQMYEEGELIELSRIENLNIQVSRLKH